MNKNTKGGCPVVKVLPLVLTPVLFLTRGDARIAVTNKGAKIKNSI